MLDGIPAPDAAHCPGGAVVGHPAGVVAAADRMDNLTTRMANDSNTINWWIVAVGILTIAVFVLTVVNVVVAPSSGPQRVEVRVVLVTPTA